LSLFVEGIWHTKVVPKSKEDQRVGAKLTMEVFQERPEFSKSRIVQIKTANQRVCEREEYISIESKTGER
jgi:hypothetical protein